MVRIIVAGDYCPMHRVADLLDKGDYSFFDKIKSVTEKSDYAIVNLECPIVEGEAKPIKKCGPNLRTISKVVDSVRYGGFNGVTLANNHFRDFGDEGCNTTINELRRHNLDFVGGGSNLAEAQQVLYKKIQGKTLAVVNICENEFSIASSNRAGSAPIDLVDNYNQIREARANSDYVLLIIHGGHEFYRLPSPRMKKMYRHFVDLGVDAVVNHHQHCYSGYEYYKGKPIVYGLGNLCFDSPGNRDSIWNDGYMVKISFDTVTDIELIPYKQCNHNPLVELLDDKNTEEFNLTIAELNEVIANDALMIEKFNEFVETKRRDVMRLFASYHNRYLNAAAARSIIPYPLRSGEIEALENYTTCESHRDVVSRILSSLHNY